MDVKLFWQSYKLFPYETIMAHREIRTLLQPDHIVDETGFVVARGCKKPNKARYLTFFSKYEIDGELFDTLQAQRENNIVKRQNTRYYAHGIHDYKGKFNPQIVRTLLNTFGIESGANVLDPFCGSGTSLLECTLQGVKSFGVDINPMAVFIANIKTSIAQDLSQIRAFNIHEFIIQAQDYCDHFIEEETERTQYLHKWFNLNYYKAIESVKHLADTLYEGNLRNLILITTSNLLRDYSRQEPSDLRIRKRTTSAYPTQSIWERLSEDFISIQEKVLNMQSEDISHFPIATIFNESIIDFKNRKEYSNFFDFALTSPPYATALPYIDTQRLSIVWLGMSLGKDIKGLECSLIGTRELISKLYRDCIHNKLIENSSNLSNDTFQFCMKLQNALTNKDGFRKQDVPILLYKYFSEMSLMFESVYSVLKDGAHYCLIVGYNKTTIGGDTIIDTPLLLSKEAERIGFTVEEILPLEAYQRYELHKKNAITTEALIILKK